MTGEDLIGPAVLNFHLSMSFSGSEPGAMPVRALFPRKTGQDLEPKDCFVGGLGSSVGPTALGREVFMKIVKLMMKMIRTMANSISILRLVFILSTM